MKRMFRWKDVLIVALHREGAWEALRVALNAASMEVYEQDHRSIGSVDGDWYLHEAYNAISAIEYLVAVDPGLLVEISDNHIPESISPGPVLNLPAEEDDERAVLTAPFWTVTLEAWAWAQILPIGWVLQPED